MRRVLVSALVSIIFVSICQAQDSDRENRRGRRGFRGPRGGWIFDRIARDLQLDEEQTKQFDEIRAAHRERMDQFRERWDAVRQARDEGNEELADQLRQEMRDEMREAGGPRESIQEALDELDPILTEDQRAQLQEMRDRERGRGERFRRQRRMAEELPDQLEMDEDQRAQYQELMQTNRRKMRESFQNLRPLFQEMREARESNDDARADEIQAQLDNMRPDPREMRSKLFDQVEGILRDDQKQRLQELREENQAGGPETDGEMPGDLRTAIRAAMQLDLARDQKSLLREINADARKAMREARRTDRENRSREREAEAALTAKVKSQILEMLTEEQTAKYQEGLSKMSRKRGERRPPPPPPSLERGI